MSAKSSTPRMPTTIAELARELARLAEPAPAASSAPCCWTQEAVFLGLPDLIAHHQEATLQVSPKWSTRWRFHGKRVERTPSYISFKEYAQELEVVLETSEDVQAYFNSIQCWESRQTVRRNLAILYDDMREVFDQNSKELRKNKDLDNGTVNPVGIQACTKRAKSLRGRFKAIIPTDANTRGTV